MKRLANTRVLYYLTVLLLVLGLSSFIVSANVTTIELTDAELILNGIDASDYAGRSVASGDIDGDGKDDVIIGADSADPGGDSTAGEVYVFLGGQSSGTYELSGAHYILNGIDASDMAGYSVASGDIDGDDKDDVIIGAYNASGGGEVYVFLGGQSSGTYELSSGSHYILNGIDASDCAGRSVASGDIDGDGKDDVIIGAIYADPGGDSSAGEVYVFLGGQSSGTYELSGAHYILNGIDAVDKAGRSVSSGDFDGDGKDDVIIGAYGGDVAGEVYVFLGGQSSGTYELSSAHYILNGITSGDQAGFFVSSGDINGDGGIDVIIGAPYADPGGDSSAGEVYVVYGTPSASTPPTVTSFTTENGSTDFSSEGDLTNVSNMKLATSSNSILWDGANINADGEDYDSYVNIGSGFVSMDVANVDDTLSNDSGTISGFSAKVRIRVNGCSAYAIYHANGFHPSLSSIKGDGSVITCNNGNSSTCAYVSSIDCSNNTLSFDVTHFDGYGGEGSSAENISTTLGISNVQPVITATPSDNGSHGGNGTGSTDGNPTNSGDNITFDTTAKDVNSDQYYAAFCSSDSILSHTGYPPTCEDTDHTWAISTITNSDAEASVTYTTGTNTTAEAACTSSETCSWYTFVCDDSTCFPTNGSGNQGYAIGTVTFDDVPDDGDNITIDSTIYEFDTAGDGVTGGSIDVDTSAAEDGADTAVALVAGDDGGTTGSTMYVRGTVAYVFADAEGTSSIGMTENQDTSNYIALSDTTLSGGDTEDASPFYVNHRPSIGTVTIEDSGSDTIEPGEDVYFITAVTDTDTESTDDTIDMHVCLTDSFTEGSGCDSQQTICSTTANASGGNATCDSGDLSGDLASTYNPASTTSGQKTVYIFLEDNHDFRDAGTDNTQTYTITNTPPTVVSVTLSDTMDPAAGDYDTITWTAVINDDNGEDDIATVTGYLYDDTAVNLSSGTCTETEVDCYKDADNCDINTTYGTDTQAEVTCSVIIWFNANASSNWKAHVNPSDGSTTTTDGDDSSAITNPELQGIDIAQGSIAYSTVVIGGTSDRQETSIGNVGNIDIDIFLDGADMECIAGACGSNTIGQEYQKWYHVDESWDWNAVASSAGPYLLIDSTTPGAGGTDDETGCLNRNVLIRSDHTSTSETNESIWWKIRIPDSQASGSYAGSNTFTSTSSSTCSEAQSY